MQNYKIKAVKFTLSVCVLVFFYMDVCFSQVGNHIVKTVVIDAGHGGKDPGTHGNMVNEKTVCLAMALNLGEMIKKNYPDVKVIYTRDKDVFVELDERASIANRNNADLFICIHANSASPAAYGVETYVLGLHRTEAQLKIAEKENSSIYLEDDGGAKYKSFNMTPDAIIFKQIQMASYLDMSIKFATNLQTEFTNLGRYNRGVKQAGFLVLYKTTMPSVLIETGFLTNEAEERFLKDAHSQEKMAEAMFVAFQKYKNELEGKQIMKDVKPIVKYEEKPSKKEENKDKDKVEIRENKTENEPDRPDENSLSNKVIFRIQIETSSKSLATNAPIFNGLPIYEYFQGGLYKYTTGEFVEDFKKANEAKSVLREQGFANAFVVAFFNGERIDLNEALKRSK